MQKKIYKKFKKNKKYNKYSKKQKSKGKQEKTKKKLLIIKGGGEVVNLHSIFKGNEYGDLKNALTKIHFNADNDDNNIGSSNISEISKLNIKFDSSNFTFTFPNSIFYLIKKRENSRGEGEGIDFKIFQKTDKDSNILLNFFNIGDGYGKNDTHIYSTENLIKDPIIYEFRALSPTDYKNTEFKYTNDVLFKFNDGVIDTIQFDLLWVYPTSIVFRSRDGKNCPVSDIIGYYAKANEEATEDDALSNVKMAPDAPDAALHNAPDAALHNAPDSALHKANKALDGAESALAALGASLNNRVPAAAPASVKMVPIARVKLTKDDNFKYITNVITEYEYNTKKEPSRVVEGIMFKYVPYSKARPLLPPYAVFYKKYKDPNVSRGFIDISTKNFKGYDSILYGVITDKKPLKLLSQEQLKKEMNRVRSTWRSRIKLDLN
jgi:hypothetical protein